ncbi:Phenol hydroxylase, P1 oxygenase component DmpL [hydrothermal vent metagenome]|uniref:Phenol hydroxylase, P1 oxygenase component DmpL n=1 Tax=hydrothermal vent metagenome TaxID=652676 RepID=A0A3B1AUQ7_9ZZZZ
MSLEIKTNVIQPRRHTYDHIAKRLGADKPATRYQEGTWDLQPTTNFHYRPTWDPSREIYDKSLTAIEMEDWYSFNDPRQLYYGTYTMARHKMMEAEENHFKFIGKSNMFGLMNDEWQQKIKEFLLPMRHYEWGANMNNCDCSDKAYGTAISQVALFAAMDRLGIAQIISRVGLLLDDSTGKSLDQAKVDWMENDLWQGVRRMVEDSFVVEDWFELLVAQNLSMDGVVFPLFYQYFDEAGQQNGGAPMSMLNEFMQDWGKDEKRWLDHLLKVTAAESPENAALLSKWASVWTDRAIEAFTPIAKHVLGDGANEAMTSIRTEITKRAQKSGIEI